MGNNPETPPEWFDETYSDPQNSGEADGAVQQQLFESTPDDSDRWVANYIGSLMERGVLGSDSEERGQDQPGDQEYDQAAADMNRIADISKRVLGGQKLTAQDVYFLRKYDSETQNFGNFGYNEDPRIDEILQERDASADLDMMLQEFDQTQLFRGMMDSGVLGMKILAVNLEKFHHGAVDRVELARKLMASRGEPILADNLEKFPDGAVDPAKLAWELMDNGVHGMEILAQNLDKFLQSDAVDHFELAREMMARSLVASRAILTRNLHKFREVPDDVRGILFP